jgi:hypothetical protein
LRRSAVERERASEASTRIPTVMPMELKTATLAQDGG